LFAIVTGGNVDAFDRVSASLAVLAFFDVA
jgi:hypothetical protein